MEFVAPEKYQGASIVTPVDEPLLDHRDKKCSNSSGIESKNQVAVERNGNLSRESRLEVSYTNMCNTWTELIAAAADHNAFIFDIAETWLTKADHVPRTAGHSCIYRPERNNECQEDGVVILIRECTNHV